MSNEVSRQQALQFLDKVFSHLSQFAHLLFNDPTQCWYLKRNGLWESFDQEEGTPQGCPFSPVCSALVLHTIIKPIDTLLRKRAKTRKLLKKRG